MRTVVQESLDQKKPARADEVTELIFAVSSQS